MDKKKLSVPALQDPIGMHVILDLYECEEEYLDNINKIEEVLTRAAKVANSTILDKHFRKFNPQGVTGMIIVAESHISIHTWPEYKYAAVDVYTCGSHTFPVKASEYIIKELKCKRPTITKIDRGFLVKE